ncbi:hypothetical protein ACFL4W_05330 [Planctomycetota bacterium]
MLKKWVENWEKADHALRRIKLKELRNYNYKENLDAIDALMAMGARNGTRHATSGLVIQQKLFSRLKP